MFKTDQRREGEIIKTLIPKLITSLTNFEENNKNFNRYVELASNTAKRYGSTSTNSYEVKRKFDEMLEKLIVDNMEEQANDMKRLYEYFVSNTFFNKENGDSDMKWKILDFLMTVSYNPIGYLKKISAEELKIMIEDIINQKTMNDSDQHKSLIDELQEDFIINTRKYDSNDSDSSEWSESSTDLQTNKIDSTIATTATNKNIFSLHQNNNGKLFGNFLNLLDTKQKLQNYNLFTICQSEAVKIINRTIQYPWWFDDGLSLNRMHNKNLSKFISDLYGNNNFCLEWNTHLIHKQQLKNHQRKQHMELINFHDIQIITEYQFLRELIAMFSVRTSCKLFDISNQNEIKIHNKISLTSTTMDGFKHIINFYLPYIKIINDLQLFIKSITNNQNQNETTVPKTYEFYAAALQDLLEPFYEKIFKIENSIKFQRNINTAISLMEQLNDEFSYLKNIYAIHKTCILDYVTNLPHICSAFLLTNLLSICRISSDVQLSNLSATLFLSSIKVFCYIIDAWWTDGRLDDWKNEFLIEKTDEIETTDIHIRLYKKSKAKSFFVASEISNNILNSKFFKLLLGYTLEAGYTLNLLTQINKIGNLKNISNYEDNLYNLFLNDVLNNMKMFESDEAKDNDDDGGDDNKDSNLDYNNIKELQDNHKNDDDKNCNTMKLLNNFIGDDLLRMAFKSSNIKIKKYNNIGSKNNNRIVKIYKILMMMIKKQKFLPLEEIICKSFSNVLQQRISCANEFVINIYHNEFKILKHLQNLRRIYLFESSDLMSEFYTKLFIQIESGKNWINPFILTVQLDDIIYSRYPDMSSLYRIEIKSNTKNQTNKVIDAIDKFFIIYNLNKELKNIISDSNIQQYNKVLQFILKIKWSLWTLENLKFSKLHKNRIPYSDYKMPDFLMRRLEQLRFWIMYSMQCIHFHLMSYALQQSGNFGSEVGDIRFDKKIQNCKNLSEMKYIHESYVNTISKYCFVNEQNFEIKKYIEQMLNLVYVIRLEWENCLKAIDSLSLPEEHNYSIILNEIDTIESTYVNLHQNFAKHLNNEVYVKNQIHLSGLSAAFNMSVPY